MKRKKILLFILIIGLINLLFVKNNGVKADNTNIKTMGTYILSVPVKVPKKVYVKEQLVDYLKESGIYVRTETTGGFLRKKKKYFYIANKYAKEIVYSREIKNDVDSMIFMVKELEKRVVEIKGNLDKNLVLGYIRSINVKYTDFQWKMIAGSLDEDSIRKINEKEKEEIGIRIHEYFGQFVKEIDADGNGADYNKNLHGEIRECFRVGCNPVKLIDPSNSNKNIDLIHMFGSIDGIYYNTSHNPILIGNHRMERDIISWNGDLQTACKSIYGDLKNNNIIDFDSFENQKMKLMFNGNYGCSEDDILADLDAMNVTKMHIDHDDMPISDSLYSYYWILTNNPKFRYRTFIKTVLIDEEYPVKDKSEIARFEFEICCQFNIIKGETGYFGFNYYDKNIDVIFALMRGDNGVLTNPFGEMPSIKVRAFVVKSFIEYIEDNL